MALTDPLQWIVIAVVVVVFIMWGPKKIPELARALGKARGEFKAGADELTQAATGPVPAAPTGDALIDTANKLGINTTGMTRDEVSAEIVKRAQPAK